jgi:hypothetical protein
VRNGDRLLLPLLRLQVPVPAAECLRDHLPKLLRGRKQKPLLRIRKEGGVMARMKISQRQARRDRKRLEEVEAILARQKNRWSSEWVAGWINIETLAVPEISFAKIATARLLGHAVIVTPDSGNSVRFYAVKL